MQASCVKFTRAASLSFNQTNKVQVPLLGVYTDKMLKLGPNELTTDSNTMLGWEAEFVSEKKTSLCELHLADES